MPSPGSPTARPAAASDAPWAARLELDAAYAEEQKASAAATEEARRRKAKLLAAVDPSLVVSPGREPIDMHRKSVTYTEGGIARFVSDAEHSTDEEDVANARQLAMMSSLRGRRKKGETAEQRLAAARVLASSAGTGQRQQARTCKGSAAVRLWLFNLVVGARAGIAYPSPARPRRASRAPGPPTGSRGEATAA